MRYNQLGRTGLLVSEICLGAMTFGDGASAFQNIGALGQTDAEALIAAALDAGVNFIDTADIYAYGRSEGILGQALHNLKIPREKVVIATKVFGRMGDGPNDHGASRGHIMDSVKASLKRLQTDHIDLYQIHGFDNLTPIEETIRALDTLVQQGLVRYVGVSNWAAWQIARAIGLSEQHGLARIESLQAYYTVAARDIEREITPMLRAEQVGLMVWSPLAGGFLSGKFTRQGDSDPGARRASFDFPPIDKEKHYDLIEAMQPMAQARGCSVARIALAWLLRQPQVTTVIIGAKRPDQLADNLAACAVQLSDDEAAKLETAGRLPSEYPGWVFARQSSYRSTDKVRIR
jgi:aryl-alcohol dehydrogenase-like predicted oxidoreductase